jgi:hypothetical protein
MKEKQGVFKGIREKVQKFISNGAFKTDLQVKENIIQYKDPENRNVIRYVGEGFLLVQDSRGGVYLVDISGCLYDENP